MTLPPFAAERRAAAPLLLSTGACYQQTHQWSLQALLLSTDGTDRQAFGRFTHPVTHNYYAGSVKKSTV